MKKPAFYICENKNADQLHRVNNLNLKIKSSYLLWLYSLDCVGCGRKPRLIYNTGFLLMLLI